MFKFGFALSFVALMAVIGLSSSAAVEPTVFRSAPPPEAPAIILPPLEEFDDLDDVEDEEDIDVIIEEGPDEAEDFDDVSGGSDSAVEPDVNESDVADNSASDNEV